MTQDNNEEKVLKISDLIGQGYNEFWNFKGLYRVVKGSRASKKSKTTAYWYIINLMDPNYSQANLLVVRKTFASLEGSCYNDLRWVIDKLGVGHLWTSKTSPLELTYLPTNQKIYFRGLDDPLRIASISVAKGFLCWLWVEEAYEITNEEDFDMLNESIRGALPAPLFQQITLTFNPWDSRSWLKKRFFDVKDPNIFAMTTTYKINEWLSDIDKEKIEKLKIYNPRRYKVAGLGEWGITGGQIYDNYEIRMFDPKYVPGRFVCGLDFGYENDPSALFVGKVDTENRIIYVYDEWYEYKKWNSDISRMIYKKGYAKERIIADSASPKDIQELKYQYGITRIRGARKGGKMNTILNGIGFIQNFQIIIHPNCKNFIDEISTYMYRKDRKTGQMLNEPEDTNNHLMDAMRYALEPYIMGSTFKFY